MPGTLNPSNLRGTRRTLDECEGDAALDEGILSRAGWTLFDDSVSVVFDEDGWVAPRPDHAVQDWYFFDCGHDYKAALADYVRFGGVIPLIPRFVLGAWWSRYWVYSAQDLKDLVQGFEEHDLPLDVLVVDMDWHMTWITHLHFHDSTRCGRRPMLYSRWGGLGTIGTISVFPATRTSAGQRSSSSPISPPRRRTSPTAGGVTTSAGTRAARRSQNCSPAGVMDDAGNIMANWTGRPAFKRQPS